MKSRKIIAAVLLAVILVLVVGTTTASAASLSELRKQIREKQSELDEGKKQEESLSQKLNELEEAIAQNEDKLIVLEEDLRAAEEKVETQTTNLNSRLRNMYKNGSVGFLDVLLNSGSFSEFLTNLDMVELIYSSDKDVLDDLQAAYDEVEEKKTEVETLQAELNESKEVVEAEKAEIAASNEETEKMLDELQADADRMTQTIINNGSSSSNSSYLGGQMAWPVPSSSYISSPFGYRIHPIYGYSKLHTGMDIGASSGSAIVAANAGTVISSGWNGGYGKCIVVDHGGGVTTLYAHCSALYVSVGQSVTRGQQIAAVGSTGNSTGPHCHFEVRINGSYVNPYPYVT
ncbi:MAG: murein hydrolase activator EnvC family protein [Lentihominibacter sp.]